MGQTVSQPADCNAGCYLWTLPCRTEQNIIERSRAKNNRRGTAGVLTQRATGWLLSYLFFFSFVFPLFLERLRPWWLKGCLWPWASSWVSPEARHWRIWSPLPVSITCSCLFIVVLVLHCFLCICFYAVFCVKTCLACKGYPNFPGNLDRSSHSLMCLSHKHFMIVR